MTKEESDKITVLYEIYEQPMYRIAFAVLHDPGFAEDAVSNAFMRIIKKIHKIGEPRSEKTKCYIVKTIKSAAIDQYRKNRTIYERVLPITEEHKLIPDESVCVENSVSVNEPPEFLNSLNETDRKIIDLRFSRQLPWREVAENLSLSESNVRKRFERVKKNLMSMKGEIFNEEK